jgi:hypothetical protein
MVELKEVFNYANNAITPLAAAIVFSDTTILLTNGSIFPAAGSGSIFHMTLSNSTGTLYEIVKVTARSGNSCTVVRAQEGTTALDWPVGTIVENLYTKAMAASSVQAYPNRQVLFADGGLASPIGEPILAEDGAILYPGDNGVELSPPDGSQLNSPSGDKLADDTGTIFSKTGDPISYPDGTLAMGPSDPPATLVSPGTAGMMTYDPDALYVATGTNVWNKLTFDDAAKLLKLNNKEVAYDLPASKSGQAFGNAGALYVVPFLLPASAPDNTYFTIVSAVDIIGVTVLRPEKGVYISFNGNRGISFSCYAVGASCTIAKLNESEWIVVSVSPREAWTLQPPGLEDYLDDVIGWRDAVRTSDDATPLRTTLINYDQFIHSHQFFGTYDKVVDWAMLWKASDESEAVALTTLKQHVRLVANNGPWSNDGQGYAMDGVSQNIAWPIQPSVYGPPIMAGTNQRVEQYNIYSYGKNAMTIATSSSGVGAMGIRPLQDGAMRVSMGGQTVNFTLPANPIGGGLVAGSRGANTTTIYGYKNGVSLGTGTTGSPMLSGLSTNGFSIGSNNSNGVPDTYLECSAGYAAFGAQFSDAEEAINWTILKRLIARYRAQPYDPNDDEDD